ncbi:MAG: LysR family transcriptional regulator [Pseudomonadota bacterium]
MDRLTAMRVFVETADRGSMTAAAAALDMSRAMASRYLEALEDWLGARLLHRTTRRLALSEAGEQALARCRDMLAMADEIKTVAGQGSAIQGKLRLTTSSSFAQAELAAAVVDFQLRHPLVEIDFLVLDRTVNLVEERVDLAVRTSKRIDPALVARRLAACHSVLCASPAYLLSAGTPVLPEQLSSHRCIVHSRIFAPEYTLTLGEQVSTVQVGGAMTTNETSVVRAAALAGAGIGLLPTYFVGQDLAQGTLVRLLPRYALDTMEIHAVYLSRRHQPKPLRLLIDFLYERYAGPLAPWDAKLAAAGLFG